MPRRMKPVKVSTINHEKSGLRVDIFLDKNDMQFFGKVAGEIRKDQTELGCRASLIALCVKQVDFVWRKIIVVNTTANHHDGEKNRESVYLEFDVHEVAPRADGCLFERDEDPVP